MADTRLRLLERRWKETNTLEDLHRYVQQIRRDGDQVPYELRIEETGLYSPLKANNQGLQEYRHKSTGMIFVLIPAGEFMMGSTDPDESPQVRRVFDEPYLMAKYPWTGREWYRVTGEFPSHFPTREMVEEALDLTVAAAHAPNSARDYEPAIRMELPDSDGRTWGDHPVESVSWDRCREVEDLINRADFARQFNALFLFGEDRWVRWLEYEHQLGERRPDGEVAFPTASSPLQFPPNTENAYQAWLWNERGERCGFQLPTESMWEYAARAGSTTRYPNGDTESDLEKIAWFGGDWEDGHKAVGLKEPNNWGLYDNCGNVFEWTRCVWRRDLDEEQNNGFLAHGEQRPDPSPSTFLSTDGVRHIVSVDTPPAPDTCGTHTASDDQAAASATTQASDQPGEPGIINPDDFHLPEGATNPFSLVRPEFFRRVTVADLPSDPTPGSVTSLSPVTTPQETGSTTTGPETATAAASTHQDQDTGPSASGSAGDGGDADFPCGPSGRSTSSQNTQETPASSSLDTRESQSSTPASSTPPTSPWSSPPANLGTEAAVTAGPRPTTPGEHPVGSGQDGGPDNPDFPSALRVQEPSQTTSSSRSANSQSESTRPQSGSPTTGSSPVPGPCPTSDSSTTTSSSEGRSGTAPPETGMWTGGGASGHSPKTSPTSSQDSGSPGGPGHDVPFGPDNCGTPLRTDQSSSSSSSVTSGQPASPSGLKPTGTSSSGDNQEAGDSPPDRFSQSSAEAWESEPPSTTDSAPTSEGASISGAAIRTLHEAHGGPDNYPLTQSREVCATTPQPTGSSYTKGSGGIQSSHQTTSGPPKGLRITSPSSQDTVSVGGAASQTSPPLRVSGPPGGYDDGPFSTAPVDGVSPKSSDSTSSAASSTTPTSGDIVSVEGSSAPTPGSTTRGSTAGDSSSQRRAMTTGPGSRGGPGDRPLPPGAPSHDAEERLAGPRAGSPLGVVDADRLSQAVTDGTKRGPDQPGPRGDSPLLRTTPPGCSAKRADVITTTAPAAQSTPTCGDEPVKDHLGGMDHHSQATDDSGDEGGPDSTVTGAPGERGESPFSLMGSSDGPTPHTKDACPESIHGRSWSESSSGLLIPSTEPSESPEDSASSATWPAQASETFATTMSPAQETSDHEPPGVLAQSIIDQLTNKWAPLLEGVNDYRRDIVASMLENAAVESLGQERRPIIGDFLRFSLPLIRGTWPSLIASDLVSPARDLRGVTGRGWWMRPGPTRQGRTITSVWDASGLRPAYRLR